MCLCVLGIGCALEPHLVELNTFSCTNTYIHVYRYIKYTYLHYLNTYVLFASGFFRYTSVLILEPFAVVVSI